MSKLSKDKLSWHSEDWDSRRDDCVVGAWEVDPRLPLRLFYGIESSGRLSFGFVSTEKPGSLQPSKSIDVVRARRVSDSKWTLSLVLLDPEAEALFKRLSEHIYQSVSAEATEQRAAAAFVEAVTSWKKLFTSRSNATISELRGLFAELHVGFGIFTTRAAAERVASAWEGPFGGDQDFQFDSSSIEIKSTHSGSRAIDISSEYQLNCSPLFLVVATIRHEPFFFDGSTSLPAYIERIRSDLSMTPHAQETFDLAIAELSYDPTDSVYNELYFSCIQIDYYKVDSSFPKITSKSVDNGIINIRYKVLLSSISKNKCTFAEINI